MTALLRDILEARDAGVIVRSHTCRVLKERNVAEHSHGVAMLVLLLYRPAVPRGPLLAAALVHDLSEIATGDVPAPVKWANPDLAGILHDITAAWEINRGYRYNLTDEEKTLLRWCDLLEFALFALEEVQYGNRHFWPHLDRALTHLLNRSTPYIGGAVSKDASALLGSIVDMRDALKGTK